MPSRAEIDQVVDEIESRFADRARALRAVIAKKISKIDAIKDRLRARWGDHDWDRRRIDDPAGYRAATLACAEEYRVINDELQSANGDLECLPREKHAAVQIACASIEYGPAIDVPASALPDIDADRKLQALIATRDRTSADIARADERAMQLERLIGRDESSVAELAERFQLDLVGPEAVTAAQRQLDTTRQALAENRRQRTKLDAALATAVADIAARRDTLTADRDAKLQGALTAAWAQAADDVFAALRSSTALRRLIRAADDRGWIIAALDADDPTSTGREFLQQAMDQHEWTPRAPKDGR